MIRYGILGWPVEHSLSPPMHSAAFRKAGIKATYEKIPVAPEDLSAKIEELRGEDIAGFNVTLPHKQDVLALLDSTDAISSAIGAVNTVKREGEDKLVGSNTDAIGLVRALNEEGVDFTGVSAVVLGSGGAARAAVAGLAENGVQSIVIVGRDSGRAEQLVDDFSEFAEGVALSSADFDQAREVFQGAQLLIQATSATLEKSPDAIPFAVSLPFDALKEDAVVCDLVYRPRETTVLQAARTRGLRTIDGLGMLLYQGAAAFEQWTGKKAPVDVMRAALESELTSP